MYTNTLPVVDRQPQTTVGVLTEQELLCYDTFADGKHLLRSVLLPLDVTAQGDLLAFLWQADLQTVWVMPSSRWSRTSTRSWFASQERQWVVLPVAPHKSLADFILSCCGLSHLVLHQFVPSGILLANCLILPSLMQPQSLKEGAMSHYIFDNAARQANQRFSSLETLYDPWTISHLEETGINPGWQCWEVGGGGGSIAAWLAERCGPTGHVLVTDIDPRFLVKSAALDQPQIEIQRHDIANDPLPEQLFDLIHASLVLFHVPTREQALQRMMTALKPGGRLILDEYDRTLIDLSYPTTNAVASALYQKMFVALNRVMEAHGVDIAWGRSLYRRLRALGLVEVGMEGYTFVWEGGSACASMMRANFEQVRQEATSAGFITNEEVEQVCRLLDDSTFAISQHPLFTAWGRRP